MPRDGAVVLSDLRNPTLSIFCEIRRSAISDGVSDAQGRPSTLQRQAAEACRIASAALTTNERAARQWLIITSIRSRTSKALEMLQPKPGAPRLRAGRSRARGGWLLAPAAPGVVLCVADGIVRIVVPT